MGAGLGAVAGLLATRAWGMRTGARMVIARPLGAMIVGAVIGILFASPLIYPTHSENVEEITSIQHLKTVIAQHPVVLVDFYADWCGPCRAMKPVVHKLADRYKGRIKIVTVDITEHEDISRAWHIKSIPDIRIYKNGNLDKMNQGYRSYGSYCEELDLLL